MNPRLDQFNSLPPKPEHIRKVTPLLRPGRKLKLAEIVAATGLSRTQVLCVLDPMVRRGEVQKEKDSLTFSLAETGKLPTL